MVAYYQQTQVGEVAPELESAMMDFIEHKELLFRGDAISANVFSLGVGVNIEAFTVGLAVERTSYDVTNFFLGPPEVDLRFSSLPIIQTTKESRSMTNISFTTSWRF